MRPARVLSALLLSAGLVAPHSVAAAPGDLDPGFGVGGITTTDLGVDGMALGVKIGADGRITTAGVAWGVTTAVAQARYTTNGVLDPTFGSSGFTTGGAFDDVDSVFFPADGGVLAGVAVPFGGAFRQLGVARFTTDGAPDGAFGSGGVAATTIGPVRVFGVATQSDGKVVAVGTDVMSTALVAARFAANGTLDTTFGASGAVTRSGARGSAVAVQPDGKIVVGGEQAGRMLVARYDASGAADSTFGAGGTAVEALTGSGAAFALALQPDGKILAAGTANIGGSNVFVVVRYHADGTPDASFGSGGVANTPIADTALAYAMVVQSDGKIVLGGEAQPGATGGAMMALARFNADGTLDGGFGTGGVVTTTAGGDWDVIEHVALQPDGKIVAAGWMTHPTTFSMRFMVARFLGTPPVVEGPTYEFTGFFRPVRNAPALNVVNAGRAVPVKFSLGGDQGLSIFPTDASGQAMYPTSVQISCSTLEPEPGAVAVTTSRRLQYDETTDRYVYMWKTPKAWARTCRRLNVKLDDGTEHTANFRFR